MIKTDQMGGTYKCAHTSFLTNKHRKNTHKTIAQFLCLILKHIKDWVTHKKNHLENNKIQIREYTMKKHFYDSSSLCYPHPVHLTHSYS